MLIIFDSTGALRYAGGYYNHPETVTPLDESIYGQVAAGGDVKPLPVFGCAVSPRLQKSLDPLRLLSRR